MCQAILMRRFLPITACLVLVGCGQQSENNREVLRKLDAIKSELSKGAASVRWATANKNEITTVIYQYCHDKMEQIKRSEALPPETEAKIQEYEALESEFLRMRITALPVRAPRMSPGFERSQPSAADKEYEAMSKRVAEAKAPIAEIIDRRVRQAAQIREQYSVERMIAEYVKGRYDLVVDAQEKVLYRAAGDVPDITEGVISFFREKAER